MLALVAGIALAVVLLCAFGLSLRFGLDSMRRIGLIDDGAAPLCGRRKPGARPGARQARPVRPAGRAHQPGAGPHQPAGGRGEEPHLARRPRVAHAAHAPAGAPRHGGRAAAGLARARGSDAIAGGGRAHQTVFHSVMRIGEVETGRCMRIFEPVDARALLGSLAESTTGRWPKRATTSCACTQTPAAARTATAPCCSRRWLQPADNALKYAPPGTPVRLVARCHGGWSELCVIDAGEHTASAARHGGAALQPPALFRPMCRATGWGSRWCRPSPVLHRGELLLEAALPSIAAPRARGRAARQPHRRQRRLGAYVKEILMLGFL